MSEKLSKTVADLCRHGGRTPGSDSETKAAAYIAQRLRSTGQIVRIEKFACRPESSLTLAIFSLLSIAASLALLYLPILAALALLLICICIYGDISGRFYTLRRLTPKRESVNVTSTQDDTDNPAVILLADLGSGRSGIVFSHRLVGLLSRVGGLVGRRAELSSLCLWAAIGLLLVAVLRLNSFDFVALRIAHFALTAFFIVVFALLLDIAISKPVDGANSNATGTAVVLKLLAELRLENVALQAAFIAGGSQGMKSWLQEHGSNLRKEGTSFVSVDSLVGGKLSLIGSEGRPFGVKHEPGLSANIAAMLEGRVATARNCSLALETTSAGWRSAAVGVRDRAGLPIRYRQQCDSIENLDSETLASNYRRLETVLTKLDWT